MVPARVSSHLWWRYSGRASRHHCPSCSWRSMPPFEDDAGLQRAALPRQLRGRHMVVLERMRRKVRRWRKVKSKTDQSCSSSWRYTMSAHLDNGFVQHTGVQQELHPQQVERLDKLLQVLQYRPSPPYQDRKTCCHRTGDLPRQMEQSSCAVPEVQPIQLPAVDLLQQLCTQGVRLPRL